MIKITVYDDNDHLITTIKDVKRIAINSFYNLAIITKLTYEMENPYSVQTLCLKHDYQLIIED